jgi:hypothetical protein
MKAKMSRVSMKMSASRFRRGSAHFFRFSTADCLIDGVQNLSYLFST